MYTNCMGLQKNKDIMAFNYLHKLYGLAKDKDIMALCFTISSEMIQSNFHHYIAAYHDHSLWLSKLTSPMFLKKRYHGFVFHYQS